MLVLTRDEGEKVIITCGGTTIVVCAVAIRGDQVRLGFEAPQHVTIHREEVANAIARTERNDRGTSGGHKSVEHPGDADIDGA